MIVAIGILGLKVHYLFVYWACVRSEDEGLSEEEISSSEEAALVSREISLGHSNSRGGPRISTSSTNQCRGPKRFFVVLGDVLGSSVGVDMSCSDIGQGEVLKISYEKLLLLH